MGIPTNLADLLKDELAKSTFILQVNTETSKIIITQVMPDGVNQSELDIHDIHDQEDEYWLCVKQKRDKIGLGKALLECLGEL